MKEYKLTDEIKHDIGYGQYNGVDDRLKDSIRREGVVSDIFYDVKELPRVGEFTPRFLSMVIGYVAITNAKFKDKEEYKHNVSKFAALFDMDSDIYYDEETGEFRLTELLYDAATTVYESYWNYDVISKYPEELSLFTQNFNNDLRVISEYEKLDPVVTSQLINPKNLMLYTAYMVSKAPESGSEEEAKLLAKCETVKDFMKLLEEALDRMFNFEDTFFNSIKDTEIIKLMKKDEVLSLSKAIIDIFNGYKTDGEDGVKLPILSLVGPDNYPFTCTPKILTDIEFLTSLMVLKLSKVNYKPELFNSIFNKEDVTDAKRILNKIAQGSYNKYLDDIICDEEEFNIFEAIMNLTYLGGSETANYLAQYIHHPDFKEQAEVYANLEYLYTQKEEDAEVFYHYVSSVLFNLLHPAFISLLAVSNTDKMYARFLDVIKQEAEANEKEGFRDAYIIAEAYQMLCSNDFTKTVNLVNKLNELSEKSIETCTIEMDDYPDNVIPFDKSKLS